MKDFKELSEKLDKYFKLTAKDDVPNEAWDIEEEIRDVIQNILNWHDEKAELLKEIEAVRKELKQHTHKNGVVYVKL